MRLIDADALNMAFTMLRFNEDGTLRHWGDRQNWCLSGQEVEDLINSIPTIEPEPHWIPCSERLPEDGKWCIFTDGDNISVERYKFDALDHFFPPGRWFDLEDAVAWMPLPKPYKGGEKDE